MSVFFDDILLNESVSWEKLIEDIKQEKRYNPYCKHESFYIIFKQIIVSMLYEKEIVLLDADFSSEEIEKLTGESDINKFEEDLDKSNIEIPNDKSELISRIKSTTEKWGMTLYTSGTTGLPKKVKHSFQSITRFVKVAEKNNQNIWGFAYHPTHMAGVQVFFQALLNGNRIVRLFGLNNEQCYSEIDSNEITHISATPTFYRLLLPCSQVFPSVVRLTSGGEKFNEDVALQLIKVFPNAKFTNVYASTEAGTLLASENDVFSIKSEYSDLIKIESNELQIHSSLMGDTAQTIEEWYPTGDIVDIISEEPIKFKFVSRESDMINIGGSKVNPHEVEEVLTSHPDIKNARVYPKKNSVLGNIVCCEIVTTSEVKESDLRSYLQTKLQEYKIPRIIKTVTELSQTRTGKLKRN